MAETRPAGPPTGQQNPETPLTVLTRFGITTLEQDLRRHTIAASIPLGGMSNPFTGQPSMAALAVLVDDVAGRVNYYRRGEGRWTVSSELTVELSPAAAASLQTAPDEPVIATGRPIGPTGTPTLAACELTHCGRVIGVGTVHTVELARGPGTPAERDPDTLVRTTGTTLAQLMSVETLASDGDGTYRLRQCPDPIVNNLIGIVHGGVSSAGLELVASAAINHRQDNPFTTASLRVNFLRPFFSGPHPGAQSHYEGTALRVGRTAAVGDARAVGVDGRVAVVARVTGYR